MVSIVSLFVVSFLDFSLRSSNLLADLKKEIVCCDDLAILLLQIKNDIYLIITIIIILAHIFFLDYSALLTDEFTFAWIERSVSKIFGEHTKSVNGLAFTCQLLALLTENPENFQKLQQRNIYRR